MFKFDHSIIRVMRETERLSQAELGRMIRRSRAAVHQWESGRTTPTVPTLLNLARALSVEPSIFFVEETR